MGAVKDRKMTGMLFAEKGKRRTGKEEKKKNDGYCQPFSDEEFHEYAE